MPKNSTPFHHPHDTPVSSGLRFLTELIAWTAGPWASGLISKWLILPALILLVALPGIFSTLNDKRNVVVATGGPVRIGIELFLYCVAAVAPWFIWPPVAAGACVVVVLASLVVGIPRFRWLLKGAPLDS